MLPGFRFLFATTVLSVSLLVFGFGALALLRTARDNAAELPSAKAQREAAVAHEREARQTTLALLRVELIAGQQENVEKQTSELHSPPVGPANGAAPDAGSNPASLTTNDTPELTPAEAATVEVSPAQGGVQAIAAPVADAAASSATGATKSDPAKSDAAPSNGLGPSLVQIDLLKPDVSEPDLAKVGFAASSRPIPTPRRRVAALNPATPAAHESATPSPDRGLPDTASKRELMADLKLVLLSLPSLKTEATNARKIEQRHAHIRHVITRRRRTAAAAAAQHQNQLFPFGPLSQPVQQVQQGQPIQAQQIQGQQIQSYQQPFPLYQQQNPQNIQRVPRG